MPSITIRKPTVSVCHAPSAGTLKSSSGVTLTSATEATPAEYKTTAYAVFLSLIDSGDTASGWISAAIVSSLGLSFDSWVRLPEFIWVASACQLAALALVPFLRDAKPLASLYLDDAAAETEPELEPPRRTTESGAVGRSDGEDPLLAHEHR